MDRHYCGPNIVLAATGNVEPEAIRAFAESRLDKLSNFNNKPTLPRPVGKGGANYHIKDVEQVHFCVGTDACSVYDDELYTMSILDTALGGGMSSRLFQEIREKRGLAYAIGSYSQSFTAGGSFTVYGGTSPENWPLVLDLVREQFEDIMANGLSAEELERTKRLICGNIVLALEGMSGRMMRMSKNEIVHGRDIPIEETLAKVNAVTNDNIVKLASSIFNDEQVNVTAIGPESGVPSE
jgi:predicted Zn-dependent peptidase